MSETGLEHGGWGSPAAERAAAASERRFACRSAAPSSTLPHTRHVNSRIVRQQHIEGISSFGFQVGVAERRSQQHAVGRCCCEFISHNVCVN